jgi:predicted DNA-binding transcriptional regulator YafY
MPTSKEYSERERMIDKCLSSGREYTGEQLMMEVNRLLRSRGMQEITSRSTFASDINEINSKFYNTYHQDVIKRKRSGRQFLYYYDIPDFSVYNRALTDEEMNDICNMIATIRRFKGMPQFSWLETLEERFDQVLQKNPKSVVAFDDSYNVDAMRPFNTLLKAIENKSVIDIEYHRFYDDEATHYLVSPYYLKQYGVRWYLLCSFKGKEKNLHLCPGPDEAYHPDARRRICAYERGFRALL